MTTSDSHYPGPEVGDPVALRDSDGYFAEVASADWRITEVPAAVRQRKNGPWPGVVIGYERCLHMTLQWHLATGEKRTSWFIEPLDSKLGVGSKMPLAWGRNEWEATVVSVEPATAAVVRFTIQSGALRTRKFYRRGELTGFIRQLPDGTAQICKLT